MRKKTSIGCSSSRSRLICQRCRSPHNPHQWQIDGGRFPEGFSLRLSGTGECLDVLQADSFDGSAVIVFPSP